MSPYYIVNKIAQLERCVEDGIGDKEDEETLKALLAEQERRGVIQPERDEQ